MELLRDPVFAADGFTSGCPRPSPPTPYLKSSYAFLRYERSSIQAWFAQGKTTSPKSGAELPSTALTPNHDLRAQLQEFTAKAALLGGKT